MLLEQIIVEILKRKDASIEELSAFTGINPAVVLEVLERLVTLGIIEEGNSEFMFT
jgi:DNA-binding transcriptional regulator YhcF (GntR family)